MRRDLLLGIVSPLIAIATVGTVPAANAAIITTGTINGGAGESVAVGLPMYGAPGQYQAFISFSTAGDFMLRYSVIRTTNFYCDFHDGAGFILCGGDDVPIGFDIFEVDARGGRLAYSIAAPFREDYGADFYGLVFDHAEGAFFDYTFKSAGIVSYRAVTTPVPEPASWTLMIGGFAFAGSFARHHRRRRAAGDRPWELSGTGAGAISSDQGV